jgi:hypothetical protein
VRADPRRGHQRAGWHGVAWGGGRSRWKRPFDISILDGALVSRLRRYIIVLQRYNLCIVCLDITALIGFSPWCAAGFLGSWVHYLALRPIQVFVESVLR